MSIASPEGKGRGSISRDKYNAIQKAKQVEKDLVADFHERIKQLSDAGLNQIQIAQSLAGNELVQYGYGNAEILRTAVSGAVRKILTPEVAEQRRIEAWRGGLNSVPDDVKQQGRLKGLAKSHELKDWKIEEEIELLDTAPLFLHPETSRYRGKIDWKRVTEAMHQKEGSRNRKPEAYKQRYSILLNEGKKEQQSVHAASPGAGAGDLSAVSV